MHWYTLIPFDALTFHTLKPATASGEIWDGDRLPSGRVLVAALQEMLQENAKMTLSGPFLCQDDTLYFPRPFSYSNSEWLIPAIWLPEPIAETEEFDFRQHMVWDRRKPAPLLSPSSPSQETEPERQFLPYQTVLKLLKSQPLDPEDGQCAPKERPQLFDQGWKLAIALDPATHEKLKRLGDVFLIRLGEAGHQFWLESHHEPLNLQWQALQAQSQHNRKIAEQAQKSPQSRVESRVQSRVLAYLVTPGVFERKHLEVATCRAFPWEWDLAYSINQNQHQGPLVSVATANPLPINCYSLGKSAKSRFSSQVFAVPPGSIYYLEYPAALFQDQPFLQDGRTNKVHIWRQLGYSELLWIPYEPRL